MKRQLVTTALLSTLALSSVASAADGTIHFTGKVSDNACNVSPTLNVTMGEAGIDKYNVGDRFNPKDFELVLTNCPASLTSAKIRLEGMADANDLDVFRNDIRSGFATGVGIEIKSMDGSGVLAPGTSTGALTLNTVTGTNSLSFVAAYKMTGAKMTAGEVNVPVQFSVSYN